jgi:hypothetical protein
VVEIRRALIIILFLLVGCASKSVVVQETLLADGLTWKIEIELKNVYQDYAIKCNHVDRKIFSFEDCIQKMIIRDYDQYLMNYTRELCGRMPHRMFATSISHLNEMKSTKMSTYVECIDKYKIVEQQIYENLLRPSAEGAMRAPAMGPPFMMEK